MDRKKHQSQLVRNVRVICERYGCPEPSQWLAKVMCGQDPRHLSALYSEAKYLHEQHQRHPCPICGDRYARLMEIILTNENFHHAPVEFIASLRAAQKLMEYMYAKHRSVEHTGSVEVPVIPKMTEDERKDFITKFELMKMGNWGQEKVEG